jgi:ribosomal protein S18 acetylase RimI-like enzyme
MATGAVREGWAEWSLAERLSDLDVRRIAALHVASIGESVPTMLGPWYARAFFRALLASSREHLFTLRIDGRVESACVVSFEPATVYSRILRVTLPQLALASALALLRSGQFRRFAWHFAVDLLHGRAGQTHAPEITYIFTHPQFRSRGLGKTLIQRIDRFLRERGVASYYVRTIDEPSNRALAFYDAQGFRRIGQQLEGGRAFALFQKDL